MRLVGWYLLLVCVAGASGCTGNPGGCTVCTLDGGPDAGCISCDGGPFNIYVVDATVFNQVSGFENIPLFQMQLAPNGNIGIAYVELSADQMNFKPRPDPNVFNYDVLYAEWFNGALVLGPERVTGGYPVQNFVGVTLDYQANGEPAVGLLGWAIQPPGWDGTGGIDGGTTAQAYWFQHTAVVSYRNLGGGNTNPGVWTQETAEANSGGGGLGFDDAATGNACGANGSCSLGPITGLYPALFIDSAETIIAYRNVHFGSSTGPGDFANSNLDIAYGGPTSWQYFGLAWGKPGIAYQAGRSCALSTARGAFGDHSKFIHGASGNPALISDRGASSANTYNSAGTDVIFFERKSGAWNCPLSLLQPTDPQNLQTENGPYLAYDGLGQGYAVAVTDVQTGFALYKNCLPGLDCTQLANWSPFTPTNPAAGAAGYFASVALNPDNHDAKVGYYYCGVLNNGGAAGCPASQRELQVSTSVGGTGPFNNWQNVDPAGAWQTQMLYIPGSPSRLVIAYRDPTTGVLKLAVENPK